MANIRITDLQTSEDPVAGDFAMIDGAATRKVTLQSLVNAGRPFASQGQAEAGANATVGMSPLTTKQAIDAQRPASALGLDILASSTSDVVLALLGGGETGIDVFKSETAEDVRTAINAQEQNQNLQDIADGQQPFNSLTVGFQQAGTNAVERSSRDKMRESLSPQDFGAVGDGVTDDTDAVNDAVTEALSRGCELFWPGGEYVCSGNLPDFLLCTHTGDASIVRGSDTFWIGPSGVGLRNIVYAAPAGSTDNDGLTPTTPLDYSNAFNYLRDKARVFPFIIWRLAFTAGTYQVSSSRRFEGFPSTQFPIEIYGPAALGGVPTAIFDGSVDNTTVFKGIAQQEKIIVNFRDLKFVNFASEPPIECWYGIEILSENLHADGCAGTAFSYRDGHVSHLGGIIENGGNGVNVQGCYFQVGDTSSLTGEFSTTFSNLTGSGVQVSRGSRGYVRNSTFDNVGIPIECSRIYRVRTQSNSFNSWTTACFQQDWTGVLNDDPANRDTFAGTTFGSPIILSRPGNVVSSYHGGTNLLGHISWNAAPLAVTGTTRTDLGNVDPLLSPFRMPGYWLNSPTARGRMEMEISLPNNETATLEVRGETSGTGNGLLGQITFGGATGRNWRITLDFTGPRPGGSLSGRYCMVAIPNGAMSDGVSSIGSTQALSNSVLSNDSASPMRYRLYLTLSSGVSDTNIRMMDSFVAF